MLQFGVLEAVREAQHPAVAMMHGSEFDDLVRANIEEVLAAVAKEQPSAAPAPAAEQQDEQQGASRWAVVSKIASQGNYVHMVCVLWLLLMTGRKRSNQLHLAAAICLTHGCWRFPKAVKQP